MAMTLDGVSSVGGISGGVITLALTTTLANALLVAWGSLGGGDSVLSVTSSSGLTWTRRYTDGSTQELYWAAKPTAGLETISINYDYGGGNVGGAFAIGGANTVSPWDNNSSLPNMTPGAGGTTVSNSYSTNNAHDFVFFVSYINSGSYGVPTGFTSIMTNAPGLSMAYQLLSVTQSGASVAVAGFPSAILIDAVQAASVPTNTTDGAALIIGL